MAELERVAGALIKRIFDEKIIVPFTETDQLLVATWCFKTALMIQYLSPESSVPPMVYHALYAERRPPTQCVMMVARYTGHDHNGAHSIGWHLGPPPTPPRVEYDGEGYGITFFIQKLVVQIVGYWRRGPRNQMTIYIPSRIATLVQPLWPMVERFAWPPQRTSVDDAGLEQLGVALRDVRIGGLPLIWTP